MAELVDASVSKTDEVMLVPVRSRPWVQIRLNRKFLITNACDFFFLFFNPFVKTHDEQIGQTTMSSLLQAPDFLHGYICALLTNKYPPLSRLVVYCAGRPNWNECRIISQNATTCYSCAQYRYLLLLWTNNTQILHRHKASLCLFGRWKTKQDAYLILHLNKGVYVIDFAIILSVVQN